MTNDSNAPVIRVAVTAPVDAVWQAIRDRTAIRQWHGWDSSDLDAEIDEIYFTNIVEQPERHRLVVNGGDRFEIDQRGDSVQVTLTRAPLSGDPDTDAYYDEITAGWTTFLHQLRFAVERQRGATRRTLFIDGHNASTDTLIERLGLDPVAALPAGAGYAATLAGEAVSGEVWYRSPTQLGLTVAGWGEGLLVVAGSPTGAGPAGTSMLLVSTYDLPGDGLHELERRWRATPLGAW